MTLVTTETQRTQRVFQYTRPGGDVMRPSGIHYIAACAFMIATWGSSVAFTCLLIWHSIPSFTALRCVVVLGLLVLGTMVAIPFGWILGALFVAPILCRIAAKIQGAPFNEGDSVRILIGPHRDTVTSIYQIWHERGQVRVELGEQASDAVEDVFCSFEVCRERALPIAQESEGK
jgi:hypothetical protein